MLNHNVMFHMQFPVYVLFLRIHLSHRSMPMYRKCHHSASSTLPARFHFRTEALHGNLLVRILRKTYPVISIFLMNTMLLRDGCLYRKRFSDLSLRLILTFHLLQMYFLNYRYNTQALYFPSHWLYNRFHQ